jgi:hypothetical protein
VSKGFWKGCKPNSVCPALCGSGYQEPIRHKAGERIICLSSRYPEPVSQSETWSGPLRGSLFGLAPDGVFRASKLTPGAVGSYSTFSPLPGACKHAPRRYVFCGTIRQDASRHHFPRVSSANAKVTRHRALWCSDFPPPPGRPGRSGPPPFQNRKKYSVAKDKSQAAFARDSPVKYPSKNGKGR